MSARDAWREVCMAEYRITGDITKAVAFADSVEQRIRLATLREVRKAAIALDQNPENDPYSWGYGGRVICKMLSAKVREARGDEEPQA